MPIIRHTAINAARNLVTIVGAITLASAEPALATQAAGGSTGGAAPAPAMPSGQVSAPPANSAMRRAGGGTVAPQASMGRTSGGTATPTNAMTLTSGADQGMQGDQRSTGQAGSGRTSTQPSISIDSNGLTQRQNGNATPR